MNTGVRCLSIHPSSIIHPFSVPASWVAGVCWSLIFINFQIFTQKNCSVFTWCACSVFKFRFHIKGVCRTLSFTSGCCFPTVPDWGGRWCLRASWPFPAWFTQCACLIWTWTITQLKKGKHISCGSFEVELEEQEPRRCAGLFCISSHVSLMCRSGRWSRARTPTDPENGGLDSKSQPEMFSRS